MIKPRPLLCYGAFIDGQLDVRTVRHSKPGATVASELWNPRSRKTRIRQVYLKWRRG